MVFPMANQAIELAVWSTAYVNDLPDGAFLFIEPGGSKDADGRTTPRSLRHLPVYDSNGKLDLPHLRAALSRMNQTSGLSQSRESELRAWAERKLEEEQKAADDRLTSALADAATTASALRSHLGSSSS